jgi:hypothetical protein
MNDQEILEKINKALDMRRGEKAGGSGHLSNVTISDVRIDKKEETTIQGKKHLKVWYSYTVDIESEFSYADEPDPDKEPDPYDPYHYREKAEITIPL